MKFNRRDRRERWRNRNSKIMFWQNHEAEMRIILSALHFVIQPTASHKSQQAFGPKAIGHDNYIALADAAAGQGFRRNFLRKEGISC